MFVNPHGSFSNFFIVPPSLLRIAVWPYFLFPVPHVVLVSRLLVRYVFQLFFVCSWNDHFTDRDVGFPSCFLVLGHSYIKLLLNFFW